MKHTMKIMIPFLMIAGLLTGCGSQESTDTSAEKNQATEEVRTTAISEKETQTETAAVTEAPEETTDETADSNILVVYYSAQDIPKVSQRSLPMRLGQMYL